MTKIYYSNVGLPTLTEAQKEKAEADVKRLNEEMLQSHINRMKRRDQLAYNQSLQHSLQNPNTPKALETQKEKAAADVKRLNEEMLQSYIKKIKQSDKLACNQTLQHSLQNPDTPNALKAEVAPSKPNLKHENSARQNFSFSQNQDFISQDHTGGTEGASYYINGHLYI